MPKDNSASLKVLILTGSGFRAVEDMFKKEGWEITNDLDEADLVQFVGGADVDPALYGENTHPSTRSDKARDEVEAKVFNACLEQGIPMAGICRGGQFLNVMNGGKMYQDVDGHNMGVHPAYLEGAVLPVFVSSTHHQMMIPNWATDFRVLMRAAESTRKWGMSPLLSPMKYENETFSDHKARKGDYEAILYPGTRCLCYQPHPEFTDGKVKDAREIYFMFIEDYLFGQDVDERLEA